MKTCVFFVVMIIILVPSTIVSSRHISRPHQHNGGKVVNKSEKTRDGSYVGVMRRGAETVQVAGSRLPDCSHACGSCRPCRLVMVSFICSSLEEAETCPMAYKCMCKNKSYPVP